MYKNIKHSYDVVNDLFYAYREKSNVHSNILIGDFHLEVSLKGEITGIEILNASDVLSEYGIPKSILENIDGVDLKVVTSNKLLIVFIIVHSHGKEASATITMNALESPIMEAIA